MFYRQHISQMMYWLFEKLFSILRRVFLPQFRAYSAMDSSVSEKRLVQAIYDKAEDYWSHASEDVDGMLGGFAELHQPDILLSRQFIANLQKKKLLLNTSYALDCGAGIGRVTKHLLLRTFDKVDMEDVVEGFIAKSREYIGADPKLGETFVEGMQTFSPPERRYDMIWMQWCTGHLTDYDLIQFLNRCKNGLRDGGVIVLKDNLAAGDKSVFDSEDNSWTRPEDLLLSLFEKANLRVVQSNVQTGFPKGMYKVKMYALKI